MIVGLAITLLSSVVVLAVLWWAFWLLRALVCGLMWAAEDSARARRAAQEPPPRTPLGAVRAVDWLGYQHRLGRL